MKKCISIILVIALIFSITYTYVYASGEEETFFELSETEVSQGDSLELIINLNEIEYDYFDFELTSNYSLDDVELSDEDVEISEEESEEENYTIKIQIDKTNLEDINTIVIYYTVPDSVETGETITFVAAITNLEDNEQTQTAEVEVTIVEEDDDSEESNSGELNTQTQGQSSNEDMNYSSQSSVDSQSLNSQGDNSQDMSSLSMSTQDSTSSMSSEKSVSTTKTTQSETEENQVTYNGSDNNYLSELYIEDIDLTQSFAKDNNTYFATVDSDIEDIEIVATAEDDDAIVCIYGNEDLQDGVNKVLISVTAENGNVRYYRIYVTKS